MNMRRASLTLSIVVALVVAGSIPALAGKAHEHTLVANHIEGVALYYPSAPGCTVFDGITAQVKTFSTASGKVSHLGHVTMEMVHCYYDDDSIRSGEFTLTDANGDTIAGTYTGAPGTMWVDAVVVEGTGRYAAATGALKIDYELGDIWPDPMFAPNGPGDMPEFLYSLIGFHLKGKVTF